MRSNGAQLLRFTRDGGDVSGIRTNAAAELLGVSPNTLRSWERRFGYPKPRRTQGGHRQYDLAELESLRRALLETHNISSAIELARQRGEGPSSPSRLVDAWDHFDETLADRVMEESLAVRSVERSVEEVLRFDSPVQLTGRWAQRDTEVEGIAVRTGEQVMCLIGSANRDPGHFGDPDRFDITRPDAGEHLAFSSGAHYCLGAPLARLEGEIAFRALAERAPGLGPPALIAITTVNDQGDAFDPSYVSVMIVP
jgi:DNA-binding transcriptional MerR regulator